MLADDYVDEHLKFPVGVQPKIDGVRGLNVWGRFVGRSLKTHANKHVTAFYSRPNFSGLDGEMIVGIDPTLPRLCNLTAAALSTIEGSQEMSWWLFDWLVGNNIYLPYLERYRALKKMLPELQHQNPLHNLQLVPMYVVHSLEELKLKEAEFLAKGYEGIIIRDLQGKYKHGRSTVREGGFLRGKPWIDWEFVVTGFEEGKTNLNEATINFLGLTERSSHKANLVHNGKIGVLLGRAITGPYKDTDVRVNTGKLTDEELTYWFQHSTELIGKIGKAKSLKVGVKEKPRYAQWHAWRSLEDMS